VDDPINKKRVSSLTIIAIKNFFFFFGASDISRICCSPFLFG